MRTKKAFILVIARCNQLSRELHKGILMSNYSDIKTQLNEIMNVLQRIEAVIDTRFLGMEKPDEDDIEAIEDFEKREREGKLELRKI
jgi:hypothetical protein